MIGDEDIEKTLDEILEIDRVFSVIISSYEGLIILEKGLETVNKKKLSVEIAKIAKNVKTHLPTQLKEGIILCIYYEKYKLLISFFENFIISSLCDRNVNMGFLRIKMRDIIPQIKTFL